MATTTPDGGTRVHRNSVRARLTAGVVVALVAALSTNLFVGTGSASAATSTSVSLLTNGGFEQGVPQSSWAETQSSGGELIDQFDPHTGVWAADLCDIDSCTDGHGNAGDTLVQAFVDPGQVVSARLSYYYNVATAEPNNNAGCKDRLTVGLGVGRTPEATATTRYCAPTSSQYVSVSRDVTAFMQSHGGQTVDAQLEGYTDALYPSQFLVDDVTLSVTYLVTPSAPVMTPITDCSVGQTTLTWSAPRFPLGSEWPVQSYLVTPYNVHGVAQTATTVPGTQTSLSVSLSGGSVCYFTVTATNANGVGPAGSPAVPVAAVAPLSTPTSTGFTLHWALQPASAAATSYTVFIRDGVGPWLKWGKTSTTASTVYGFRGHLYEYYVEGFNAGGAGVAPSGNGQTSVTVPLSATPVMGFKGLYGVDAYGALHPADSPPLSQSFGWSSPLARGVALAPSGAGGYVVDAYGGVHAFGNAPAVSITAYWSGWDIARGIVVRPNGVSGYVLDGFGGVHAFGGAPNLKVSAYYPGWDIARAITLESSGAGGYILDGWGGVHSFGDARAMAGGAYWSGWDIARGIALRSDGTGGYVLDGWGGVHPFGGAPYLKASQVWPNWDIARAISLLPTGTGGYVTDGYGGFHPFGAVTTAPGTPSYAGGDVMRGASGA